MSTREWRPKTTRLLDVEVVSAAIADSGVWALTGDSRLLRIPFDRPLVEEAGCAPEVESPWTTLTVVRDEQGEVLALFGEDRWMAFDLSTGDVLWQRSWTGRRGEYCDGLHLGEWLDEVLVQLFDVRSGNAAGAPVPHAENPGPAPSWAIHHISHVLTDETGQSRAWFDGLRSTWRVDPKGRSVVAIGDGGIDWLALQ